MERDAFDDALERMRNAMRTAHAAFQDADAALTIALEAERTVSREKGSLRETLARLEQLVMNQGAELRDQGAQLRELRERLGGNGSR